MVNNSSLKPRQYQLQLVDHLCEQNGILYLPTGCGKTYVAIMVMKRLSRLLQYPISEGGKRTIFMCNTVELARQQCIEIRECTNFKVALYTGDRGVDKWDSKQWSSEIEENQILVGTTQVFVDCILQNFLKITDINLVVIDECHHATKNHPMSAFLSLLHGINMCDQPRVIGLTAVLIKGNKLKTIDEELKSLEAIFNGNIVTVRSTEEFNNVMLYGTKPSEYLITYKAQNAEFSVESNIQAIIGNWKTVVDHYDIGIKMKKLSKGLMKLQESSKKKFIQNLIDNFMYQAKEYGLYAASIAIMFLLIDFEIKKRQSELMALRKLYDYCITRCEHIKHLLTKEFKTTLGENSNSSDSVCNTKDVILNYSSPKIKCFLTTLIKMFKDKKYEDITCLVFVQRRCTAKCIFYIVLNYIKQCPELKDIITPQFVVGSRNNTYSIHSILEKKWNTNVLHQLRTKLCNLIVCSNVFEEGIDIQDCNYVFVLDDLTTFNSYIQTKGRARGEISSYIMFCNVLEYSDTTEKINSYKAAHEYIKEFLLTRTLISDEPNMTSSIVYNIIPPFKISSGAQLVETSVLPLLYRYCQSLPWDMYGICLPWFYRISCKSGCQVVLQLPVQSKLKETITSDVMQNVRECKISAAFKACIKLYELGELNDHLLPLTKSDSIEKVSEDLFKNWNKHTNNVLKQLVDKNHIRLYDKQCPTEFYDALPRIGEKCYAYSIKFFVDFSTNDYNAHVAKYLNTKATYAILLCKRLPKLAEMPLFISQGKLRVQIDNQPVECMLCNNEQLEKLIQFHIMIFRDLLELWRNFFVIDRRNKENAYLIVPMDSLNSIDWNLVQNFQRLVPLKRYISNIQGEESYQPEHFLDMVVKKRYSVENIHYVVTKIRHDLHPMSPFSNTTHKNYVEFFESRYNVKVTNNTQFLLEVKALTKRRNFFNNASGKSIEIKRERNEIILIPELCYTFNFPGSMWLKALFLPSILHRVYYMLHAETLRQKINNYLGLDKYFSQYEPKALTIDTSLKRAVDTNIYTTNEEEYEKNLIYLNSESEHSDDEICPPSSNSENKHSENEEYPTSSNFIKYMKDSDVKNVYTLETPWKEYMEPIDITRQTYNIFPLELDYYHKFVHGLLNNIKNIDLTDDEIWSKSQLVLPTVSYPKMGQKTVFQGRTPQNSLLCITNAPNKNMYYLNILERSFQKESDLQSAEQHEFLAAITTASVGEIFDMERLELLGDAFLKFSASLYLANKYPKWNEGHLTAIKSRMVSNRNLLYCMLEMDICNRICDNSFAPNIRYLPPLVALPENLLKILSSSNCPFIANISSRDFHLMHLTEEEILSGFCDQEKLQTFKSSCQSVEANMNTKTVFNIESDMNMFVYKETHRNKVVADTLEALLGVCVKNYGIQRSFKMLEFFGIINADPTFPLTNLLDLKFDLYQSRHNIDTKEINAFLVNGDILENNLGYKFRDRSYLLQAITHPSNPTNRLTGCYQELEFIGDAILDMLITSYIFERNKQMTPGMMTDMRMALVNNITLACVCVRHRFHLFMLYENPLLSDAIKKFAAFQKTQNYRFTEHVRILMEEESIANFGDMEKPSESNMNSDDRHQNIYNLAENIDVPKALGDIVEALIAAVYLDSKDLFITWRVIYNLLEPEIMEFSRQVPSDPVRELIENKLAHAKFSSAVKSGNIFMVTCTFNCLNKIVEVNGFGSNSKFARKAAAKHALRILRQKCK